MPLEGKRPALNWLQDVADRMEALVSEPAFMERFRAALRALPAEKRTGRIRPARPMALPEKCVLLAAIHDRLSEGTKINPWMNHDRLFAVDDEPGPDDRIDPAFAASIAYDFLCEDVDNLGDDRREYVQAVLREVENELGAQPTNATNAGGAGKKPPRRRRQGPATTPLTTKQTQAMHLIGEMKGNKQAAARAMGVTRATFDGHLKAAYKKLGRSAPRKPRTQRLPTDRRGQPSIADRAGG